MFHQTVVPSLRLNSKTVEHARLPDGEVADVDHLLHFTFTFGQNFARLEGDELTKLVFELAKGISQTPDGIAADRSGCDSPF